MNKPITIIAFYPGGGGNRYLRKLLGEEYSTLGIAYDNKFKNQTFEHRYLLGNIPPPTTDVVLTHCMNVNRIREVFNPGQILVIKTDLFKSLRREWILNGHKLYNKQYTESKEKKIVELYNAIKTDSWPMCNTYKEFSELDAKYQTEVLAKIVEVPIELHSAWATITWHREYYKEVDITGTTEVDDVEFLQVIETELDSYQHPIFHFCQQQYEKYGPTAPIVELYNQHIRELNLHK